MGFEQKCAHHFSSHFLYLIEQAAKKAAGDDEAHDVDEGTRLLLLVSTSLHAILAWNGIALKAVWSLLYTYFFVRLFFSCFAHVHS